MKRPRISRRSLANSAPPAPSEHITPERVTQSLLQRFNPIRRLTPELLATQLEQLQRGYLWPIMRTWEAMERRDDRLSAVAPKAKSSLARHGYEVIAVDDSSAAQQHKEALEYFYSNLTVVDAYEENNQGKFSKLVRTMANAIGQKIAVHEIQWQPSPSGLTATFRFAPPWFFESLTGRLRFLTRDFDYYGVEMDPAEWLITAGDGFGIDEACSVAYMFKHLPLKDWINYSEKFGMPGVLGKTSAAKGSDQWNAMVDAVARFANDFAAVCSLQDTIELVKAEGASSLPFAPIIEKMDQAMSILWRGADLSTASHSGGGQGQGASLQDEETQNIDQDRAQTISEVLQIQIDRRVLWYTFGDVPPLAKVQLKTAPKQNTDEDLKVLQALVPLGVPFAVNDVLARLGWTMPKAGEMLLTPPVQAPAPGDPGAEDLGNMRARRVASALEQDPDYRGFLTRCRSLYAGAMAADLAPLRTALREALQGDEAGLPGRLEALHRALPEIAPRVIAANQSSAQLYQILSAALLSQLAQPTKP